MPDTYASYTGTSLVPTIEYRMCFLEEYQYILVQA